MKKFRIEAHRGVGTSHPENTMPAYVAAFDQGYDMIELDLKFTADNHGVLLHDKTVGRTGRTCCGEAVEDRPVSEMSFAELRELDFGIWKGQAFAGTKLPEWREVIAFAKEKGILLKVDNCFERFTAEQRRILYQAVKDEKAEELVGFTCAHVESFEEVHEYFPACALHYDGVISEDVLQALTAFTDSHEVTVWIPIDSPYTGWVDPAIRRCSPEYCRELHEKGFDVGVWLLMTEEELLFARDTCGADIIETDGSLKP